jgi:hypothetical protein
MRGTAAVTLSNENGRSRSRPSAPPAAPADAAVWGRLRPPAGPFCSPSPLLSDEPAVLGLRAHRVDLTRRPNDRSPEREE